MAPPIDTETEKWSERPPPQEGRHMKQSKPNWLMNLDLDFSEIHTYKKIELGR